MNLIGIRRLALAAALAFFGGYANGAAACRPMNAGVVVNLAGLSSGYSLQRGRAELPLRIFSELRSGDRLQVRFVGGRLWSQDAAGRIDSVTNADGPVCIRSAGRASWWSNLIVRIGELVTRRRDVGARSLVSRGGEFLLLPGELESGTALVSAGQRRLAVTWQGGIAPFAVEVKDARGHLLVDEASINSRLLLLSRPFLLLSGRYEVIVRDAANSERRGSFTVPPDVSGQGPTMPNSAAAAVGLAGQLISRGDNRLFDAFITLSPYRPVDPVVEAMMDVIAEGESQ